MTDKIAGAIKQLCRRCEACGKYLSLYEKRYHFKCRPKKNENIHGI
jgi:hypothetical protein